MADTATAPETVEGAETTETVQTPEERDAQTIARAFGPQEDETPAEESTEESEAGEEEESTEESESEEEEDVLDEISDDDVDTFIEAVGLERLLGRDKLKQTFETETQRIAREAAEEQAKQTAQRQQEATLIEAGGKALNNIVTTVNQVSETLRKLRAGELDSLDLDVTLDPKAFDGDLRALVASTGAIVRREWDAAFSDAFVAGMGAMGLKALEQADMDTVQAIAKKANALEAQNPSQGGGSGASKAFLFGESVKFLVQKADKAGYERAMSEVAAKRSALKKVVGDNSIKAAVAKVQQQRSKLPPKSAPDASGPSGGVSMSAYKAAKRSGDVNEITRITNEIAQLRAQGLPIPD